MSTQLPHHRTLESLKKEAKRWLADVRDNVGDARDRLQAALGSLPVTPSLRGMQHALAREFGFSGWDAVREALEHRAEDRRSHPPVTLSHYQEMASVLLDAYRSGTPAAMERLYRFTWHRRPWSGMRSYVQLDLGRRPAHPGDDVEITLSDAQYLVAIEHGFSDWEALATFTRLPAQGRHLTAKPIRVTEVDGSGRERDVISTRDWDEVLARMRAHPGARLHAGGQMTDAMLADIAIIETVTVLSLDGSQRVTDEGVRHLARMPQLRHLNLDHSGLTDAGLAVLHDLPLLEDLSLGMTQVTEAGMSHLAACRQLRRLNLNWTRTGDAAIAAMAGNEALRELRSDNDVTDAGLPWLHQIPAFRQWHDEPVEMALLSYDARPNQVMLRGTFTDTGMATLRGLDGLFGLNLDDAGLAITAAGMEPLTSLPNLGWLSAAAKDDWMPHIARMPRLRFLGAQDTTATDDGFVALGQSRSLEYIWGRRSHGLHRRGFEALAKMPALRGLSVSCLNVDDAGIARLPEFPALRELMPMDVPDGGYRHIGECGQLESLVLMYCRDTTDAATEHLVGMNHLRRYFNSYTEITDRTPELLSRIASLETVIFDACHGLTDDGVAKLAILPRLRELRVSGRRVTAAVKGAFREGVEVSVD